MALSVMLLRLLADAEWSVYDGKPRRLTGDAPQLLEWPVDAEVDAVLDLIADEPELARRLDLLDDLYDAAVPAVGGHAAEVLVCLPRPVLSLCWLCEGERWYRPSQMVRLRPEPGAGPHGLELRACRSCAVNVDPARVIGDR